MLIFRGEISEKSAYYTQRVNRFICNILYMIHSSNSVLKVKVGCVFLEEICDIVFGLFDTKIKQLALYMISTANLYSIT